MTSKVGSRATSTAANGEVPKGLLPTPFYERLAPLCMNRQWSDWAGFLSADVYDFVEQEYFAVRNAATLYDISPMCKYRIAGPDAESVVNRLVTRDIRKVAVGRVAYSLWCDEEGMLIDDGTVFKMAEDEFYFMCQGRMLSWFQDAAWGYDVSISDESEALCGLSLQGPTTFSLLSAAGLDSVADMRPFDLRQVEPGLWISRSGYTGDLGYELFVAPDEALKLWDRLWEAGANWGLVPIGSDALDLLRLEAGFIAPSHEFQPVFETERRDRGRTPFELGFGRLVDFNKGHFNGRRALLARKDKPRYHLVKLDIEGKEPADGSYVYVGRGKQVGHTTSAAWSPTTKRNIAIAELKAPYGGKKQDGLWVEIDAIKEGKWMRYSAKATVVDEPFFINSRARATPPGPY
ncbi:MAG: aminomethyltransferase family protein [Pseudomonadota bacterium]